MTWTNVKQIHAGEYSPTEKTRPVSLKRGEVRDRTIGGLTALVWKDSLHAD